MKSTIQYFFKWIMFPPSKPYRPQEENPVPVPVRINKFIAIGFVCFALLINDHLVAQMIIGENTTVSGSGNGMITMDSSLINQGVVQLTDQFTLQFNGEGEISSNETLVIPRMQIQGSYYEQYGDITVTDSLLLISGTIETINDAMLLIRNDAGIVGNEGSYIIGFLTHEGLGEKFYPIGSFENYAPVRLNHVDGEADVLVSLEAKNEGYNAPDLSNPIAGVSNNWHWEMIVEGDFEGSTVSLPITTQDQEWIEDNQYPTVVSVDEFGTVATNLGSSYEEGDASVTAQELTGDKFLMVGVINEVEPIIHNIITPGNDDDNPFLIVDNVTAIGDNEVSLIDRWGNEVYNSKNFRNFNDTDNRYDGEFDDLPSGNYVCLLRFNSQTISQMVTIIKE